MKNLNDKKRLLVKAGICLIILASICFSKDVKAQGDLEYQRSQNVQSYIDNYIKVYGASQPVMERLRSEHQDFYGEFGDALTALDIYIKLSNGEDWKAINVVVNSISGKVYDELVQRGYISRSIKGTLSFFTTAKAAMELFRDFVFDPYLMSEAVQTYYVNRERNLLEPADAIATVRAEGTIRELLLKEFEKQHGTEPFELNSLNLVDASGHVLKNDYWRREFQNFRVEFFEQAYKQRKFLELKEEIEKRKNELEGEMPSLESRMDAILEEILNSIEEISITPKNTTLEIGQTVDFSVVAITYRRDEIDITDEAMIVNVTDETMLQNKTTFIAESPGAHSISAIYDGSDAEGSPKRFVDYATVVVNKMYPDMPDLLLISPEQSSLSVGEETIFTASAVFEDDDSTANVTSLEETTWSTGSHRFTAVEAGEEVVTVTYRGLTAQALVVIEGEDGDSGCGEHGAWSATEQRCICDEGYEPNEELGKCISLDDAIEEITDDSEGDLCDESVFEEKLARLNELAGSGNRMAASFTALLNRFMKEINDQNSNPCGNSMIAYTYAVAKDLYTEYETLTDDITELSTDVLSEGAFCPTRDAEADFASILPILSQAGASSGQMERGIADMENELLTFGCDTQEVEDQGNVIADQTTNPEVISSGGVGSFGTGANPGVPGGPGSPTGDTDGIIILSYGVHEYAPQSSVSVSVTLNRDNFNLTAGRNSTDYEMFQNLSLQAEDQIRISAQGINISPSITLRQTDFGWIDPNSGSTVSPGNGKRIFSLTIAIFYDDDEDEMRYRMTVILGQGGFGYPGTPGGGRTFEY